MRNGILVAPLQSFTSPRSNAEQSSGGDCCAFTMNSPRLMLAALGACALTACAAPAATPPAASAAGSILERSSPAAGATLAAPLNTLILEFNPPARLDEVLVTGPDGKMPMMVTAAGEQRRYSLPLAALGPGAYSVSWRASAGMQEYRGDFAFTVK